MRIPAAVGFFASAHGRDQYLELYDKARQLSPVPVETRDVATRFGTVRVYRHGLEHGRPIVLLHPFLATSAAWAANVATLAAGGPVYTLDGLGQAGRSVQTVPIRCPADNVAWLGEALTELGLGRVHLVGWSYGGWMSLHHALADPERIASLTLVDPANTLARFSKRCAARFFALPVVTRMPGTYFDSLVDRFMAWMMIGDPDPDAPRLGKLLPILQLLQCAARMYIPVGVALPRFPSDDQLRSVQVPMLALLGGRSAVHDSNVAAHRVKTLLPDAETEIFPAATHALPAELPDEVNERILGFVAQYS